MKLETESNLLQRTITYKLTLSEDEVCRMQQSYWDIGLAKECSNSNSIADKLLCLQEGVRNLEKDTK